MWWSDTLLIALIALITERLTGYPGWLYARIGHPVTWIGRLIGWLDANFNRDTATGRSRRIAGTCALAIIIAVTLLITVPISTTLLYIPHGWAVEAVLAVPLIAQVDLRRYVGRVADGLAQGVEQGRNAVRHIVGRDPAELDEAAVARAAIESLAENTSDGVVAPVFWLALFGLPGIAVYKAINTADSMIGYKSERHIDFGRASARLDDLMNWLPARLTGILIAGARSLTSPSRGADALEAMWRDARKHVSPNAGWPEAAMAGALDIRLGGPRSYQGRVVELAWMGSGHADLDANDIRQALRLYIETLTLLAALLFACWLFL